MGIAVKEGNGIMSQAFCLALLEKEASTVSVDGILNESVLHLFTNNFQPTPAAVVGDFTEATFTGYGDVTVTSAGVFTVATTGARLIFTPAVFEATDAATPENVYGWYLTDNAGTALQLYERFAAPVPMVAANDGLVLTAGLVEP